MWPTTSVEMDGWHFILIFFFVGTKVPNTISTDSTLKLKVLFAELQMTVQVLLTENRKPRLQLAQSYSDCLGKCCLLWHSDSWFWIIWESHKYPSYCVDLASSYGAMAWRVLSLQKNWKPLLGTTDSLSICCWRRQSFDSHSASSPECQRDNSPSDKAQASGIEIVRSLLKRHPGAGSQSN